VNPRSEHPTETLTSGASSLRNWRQPDAALISKFDDVLSGFATELSPINTPADWLDANKQHILMALDHSKILSNDPQVRAACDSLIYSVS
jgi:hypothetical protein